ncbi:endonuclease/exonuclease/phosphatase family protein [Trueperella bialowiezensis]|uniref:Uncharacterized protein conserved in bacteria n=1 Tax=Trueperella bialowiezensis TaxID=312285 RepID=A0A448PER3_9ACTO|nr:endonuclease/exonuclease/phosphatase family protein [Trueperella bialowiezensis]VEI13417.1 Uncharacterized protein conserved in bacteria [Trueperella bialowiezensis]
MRFVWGLLAIALVGAGAVTLRPDLVPGFTDVALSAPMVHIMSVRPWLAVVCFGAAIFLLIFGLIRRTLVGAGRIALVTGVAYLAMALFHGGTVYTRGLASPDQLGPDRGVTSAGIGNGDITVLTYNTLGGSVDVDALVDAIDSNGVDVVVLPETATARGTELANILAERGLAFQHFNTGTDQYQPEFKSTLVLVSEAMGEYRQTTSADGLATSVAVAPAAGNGPVIVGVHPRAPMMESIDQWRADVSAIYSLCDERDPLIVAGDFNSTVDHQMVVGSQCHDAAIEAGSGGLGTWPTRLPQLLGTPIDRIVHNGAYRGVDAMHIELGSSDHRGLIVRLSPES